MSAICGIVNFDGKPVREEEIRKMMAAMKDWGPDGSGVWVNGSVGLGSLLFRVTPESVNEQQPLVGADGKVTLVCDARIDNRDDLCAELGVRNEVPDADLVLAAYMKWGTDCPVHLIGDFTLAVWDERSHALLLATDHMAHRPLFYMWSGSSIVFASSLFGLFAVRGMPDLVEDQLINYLLLRRGEKGATFYQGIWRIPGGHAAVVRTNSIRLAPYWRIEDIPDIRYPHDDDYIDAFNEVFTRAVRACCRSRLPVGIMLSGGLDSGAVAIVANRILKDRGERLQAYCAVPLPGFAARAPKGWLVDESPLVEQLRKQHDFDAQYVAAEGQSPLTDIKRDFDAVARPQVAMRNRHWIWRIADEAAAKGLGVLLTGQAGNATISWASHGYFASLVARREFRRWLWASGVRPWRPGGLVSSIRETLVPLWPRKLWSLIHGGTAARTCRSVFLRTDHIRAMELATAEGSWLTWQLHADTRQNRAMMLGDLGEIGEIGAAIGAAAKLEVRDPTASRTVIELTLGVPDEQHINRGIKRLLVRRSLAGQLPDAIRNSTRCGVQAADAAERLRSDIALQRDANLGAQGRHTLPGLLDFDSVRIALARVDRGNFTSDSLFLLDRVLNAVAVAAFCAWHQEVHRQ